MDTAAITRLIDESDFSGVVLVQQGDETLFSSATGLASRRWNVPNTLATRFDTGGVTKLFTAAALLQQVDAGTLDLEESIHEYVDLDDTTISPDVKLIHLLTHTSGIADDADEEAGESYDELWRERPTYSVIETADFLPQFANKPPLAAPGVECRYNNCGYVLLGLALEGATGVSYRELVQRQVFQVAGMTDSAFFDRRDDAPDVAEGGDADEETGRWQSNIFSFPPIGSPDAGAHATAADLVTFLRAARGAKLLTQELTEEFVSPQVEYDEDSMYGFGFEFDFEEDGEIRSMYKDGINAGVSAFVRHYAADDIDVVVLSNTEDGAWDVVRAIDEQF
ncbi:serine hydrolase domain-containing protein [Plantibacter sp. YIM 135347]|jgi:CubicO group peptidase (beta-lactamase class C family)|uniref:serine hydrolase domain-containing protein n=1 Tax=Plantibacter sp. YIM 135347 TaxID=3423919 RepID=UPI003D345DE6